MTVFYRLIGWLDAAKERSQVSGRAKLCPRPITVNQRWELKQEGRKGRQTDMDTWIKNSYISMCNISSFTMRWIWLVILTSCIYLHQAIIHNKPFWHAQSRLIFLKYQEKKKLLRSWVNWIFGPLGAAMHVVRPYCWKLKRRRGRTSPLAVHQTFSSSLVSVTLLSVYVIFLFFSYFKKDPLYVLFCSTSSVAGLMFWLFVSM